MSLPYRRTTGLLSWPVLLLVLVVVLQATPAAAFGAGNIREYM